MTCCRCCLPLGGRSRGARHGLNRLAHLDRPTGQLIRRYERDRPGELIHVYVKKLDRIPNGGHKVLGRQAGRARRSSMGYDCVHSAVDDHSRLAYSEIHDDEKAATYAAFLRRAAAFFAAHGIDPIERVLTDNVERFNRTLLDEWAYQRPYTSNTERSTVLADFLRTYKHHRRHTARKRGRGPYQPVRRRWLRSSATAD